MSAESEWARDPGGLGAGIPSSTRIGVTSAAFSVEGAVRDDGRGESTWDVFMGQAGRIVDGSTAAVAADSYHRADDDLRMLGELGVDAYRFSIGWPRLQPGGAGGANRSAVDYYDRLIDGLLVAGIRPVATLFHWDTPEPLQHVGGWLNRDTASRFADYAYLAAEVFGDRVDAWITLDDPATVTWRGYGTGTHAPGAVLGMGAIDVARHQLLGHGLAVEALRAADVRGGIGLATTRSPVEPASDSPDDVAHADLYDLLQHRLFSDPVLLGRWPEAPEELAHLLPSFDDVDPRDLEIASRPIDFIAVDHAPAVRVRAGRGALPFDVTGSGAESSDRLIDLLRQFAESYPDRPAVMLGLGLSHPDTVAPDGTIDDPARIRHLAGHIAAAVGSGVALARIDIRSLLDGWEWDDGYTQRFGLVHVDSRDQRRTLKASFRFVQRMLGARSG